MKPRRRSLRAASFSESDTRVLAKGGGGVAVRPERDVGSAEKKKTGDNGNGVDDDDDGWDRAQWAAGYRSQHREFNYSIDVEDSAQVSGQIPEDFAGTYYRNGPGRFQVGNEFFKHPFDGDGYVLKVDISRALPSSSDDSTTRFFFCEPVFCEAPPFDAR